MTDPDTNYVTFHGQEIVISKRDINGNTYVVVVYPERRKQEVAVYADDDGADHGLPDVPAHIGSHHNYPYQELHRETQFNPRITSASEPLETFVSQTVNAAVCKFEDKLEDQTDLETKVAAALEANKEVHEEIDYHLDRSGQ